MTKQDRREQMRRLLAIRERRGLTYDELAEESGLPASTLSWWSWRFRREEHEGPEFVELEVAEQHSEAALELEAPGGHVIRIGGDFDEAVLRRVLEVLSTC